MLVLLIISDSMCVTHWSKVECRLKWSNVTTWAQCSSIDLYKFWWILSPQSAELLPRFCMFLSWTPWCINWKHYTINYVYLTIIFNRMLQWKYLSLKIPWWLQIYRNVIINLFARMFLDCCFSVQTSSDIIMRLVMYWLGKPPLCSFQLRVSCLSFSLFKTLFSDIKVTLTCCQ